MFHQAVIRMFSLSHLPLKNAFQAVLWLIEKSHNIPAEEIKGWWSCSQNHDGAEWPDYPLIVQALGYDYFENSIYRGVTNSINLSNEFDGDTLITENNEVITQDRYVDESLGEQITAWLNYETDKELSRYAHTDLQRKDEDYVVTQNLPKTGVVKYLDSLTNEAFLDKAATLCKKLDNQPSTINGQDVEHEPKSLTLAELNALAHVELLLWLMDGDVQAEGSPIVVHLKSELQKKASSTAIYQPLTPELWRRRPVPHYEVDALHFGESHKLYFTQQVLQGNAELGNTLQAEHEFWFNNIRINEESFIRKINPLITRYFPIPETASMRLQGKHYIINFGNDVDVKVKASIGLTALKVLILHTNAKSNDSEGITAQLLDDLKNVLLMGKSLEEYYDEVYKAEDYHQETDEYSHGINTQRSIANQLKIRVTKDRLRKAIKDYWLIKKSENLKLKNQYGHIKVLASRLSNIDSDNDITPLIDELISTKHSDSKRLKILDTVLSINNEDDQLNNEKKSLRNKLWKGLTTALDNIQYDCPHLYYHIRGLGAGSLSGAARQHHGNTLIYQTEHQIQWDLTSLDTGKL